MKRWLRNKVVNILSWQSRLMLRKHRPFIIGVTGNLGKTTTKDYIFNFLKHKFKSDVRASEKSQNSEFGVNLTILGEKNAWNSPVAWTKMLLRNFWKIKFEKKYPKILVLEVGADKPGDIRYITSIAKPDMVVLTAFQASPSHGEFFLNIDQHINEKKHLATILRRGGFLIYNSDDEIMSTIAQEKKERDNSIKLYDFGQNANSVRIIETANLYDDDAEIVGIKIKFRINIENNDEDLEIRIFGVLGGAQSYSVAAGLVVAYLMEMKKTEILESVNKFEFAKSRMRVFSGVNHSKIVDDTYNSSPKACMNAFDTISKIMTKGKKVVILGHMAELGKKTKEEHFNIGQLAAKTFDTIVLSGRHNEYFLEGIRSVGYDLSKVFLCDGPEQVNKTVEENNLIKEGDIVLIKGSQSARLEKVVVNFLMNPHDTDNVCRQENEWEKR